ncbi:MAG: hypothetical protein Q8K12_07555 [Thiobacillus sp.]|nr:hypothetical protein [Thiobacillus sp.]
MQSSGVKTLVLAGLVALGGCGSLASPNPESPYYAYPPGWAVQLKQVLPIDPGAATVRLQYGRIVPRNGVQEQYPFCIMEVNTLSNQVQVLQPGRFEVVQVTRNVSEITAAATPLIPPGYLKAGFGGGGDAPSFLYFITTFSLRDASQPNIRSLRCAWDQMAPGNRALMRHLTLDEMRQALGNWIALIPPKEIL